MQVYKKETKTTTKQHIMMGTQTRARTTRIRLVQQQTQLIPKHSKK